MKKKKTNKKTATKSIPLIFSTRPESLAPRLRINSEDVDNTDEWASTPQPPHIETMNITKI